MKKLNSKGFGAIEVVLILVIVGILGTVGWYVWHSKNNANSSYNNSSNAADVTKPAEAIKTFDDCKKAAGSKILETFPEVCVTKGGQRFTNTSSTDITASWYLYKSPGGEYQVRLPDGWKLERYMKSASFYAFEAKDIVYLKGQKATVAEVEGGKDSGTIAFILSYGKSSDYQTPPGTKQTGLKTSQGLTVDKYYNLVTTDPEGIGPPKGTKEYFYIISKSGKTIQITHDINVGESEDLTYLEKSIQSIEFL